MTLLKDIPSLIFATVVMVVDSAISSLGVAISHSTVTFSSVLLIFSNFCCFLQGVLKVNQRIEVRPGIVVKDESGNIKCTPIYSRIVSLYAEQNELQFAVPGGLIGVGTTMDPTLTRADRLVGQVLGEVGSLPDVFVELEVCLMPSFHPNIIMIYMTIVMYENYSIVKGVVKGVGFTY